MKIASNTTTLSITVTARAVLRHVMLLDLLKGT